MSNARTNDQYANIAMITTDRDRAGLVVPSPPVVKHHTLPLDNDGTKTVVLPEKMETQAQLEKALADMRNRFLSFLEHHAPNWVSPRNQTILKAFDWRVETPDDQQSFSRVLNGEGSWEEVEIPHFGEPLGNAVTYYRCQFECEKIKENESLFIHFNGVDYLANVYVNGYFVGTHEGFFAPFEFEIDAYVHSGENTLLVQVKNDFVHKRNELTVGGEMFGGDKIYAATGPGYDDPELGWHHCPPGMGLYQTVFLEKRARTFIEDIFVRPLIDSKAAEVNIQVYHCDAGYQDVAFSLSLYGENFKETIVEQLVFEPTTAVEIGLGDTFNQAMMEATGESEKPQKLFAEKGKNFFKTTINLENFKLWTLDEPNLYELQIELLNEKKTVIDANARTFGMRSFEQDVGSIPKGKLYLNHEEIRLRGCNTMGFEQHAVMAQDYDRLIDDILLSKVTNMNFWRITQRPVQEEVYHYCDHLGLLTQSDLPLFGVLRKNKFAQAVKQAEEMELFVRNHPCNIMCTYINEPFPNANNLPQRHLTRNELNRFFDAADNIIKVANPDRVIKHVDGDYDPPSKTMPDNHCYTAWYNGHGLSMGELAEGYWFPVKKDWVFGCGEFGCEALDPIETMYKHYPKNWLAATPDDPWSPSLVRASQTPNFHYQFFDTQQTMRQWVKASQEYQCFATRWMTEAFRRQTGMVSFALHIFIDHYPAGWMKAIMDVDRQAKPAYFAYRDALTPTMISIKPKRLAFTEGEQAIEEIWICNDLPRSFDHCSLYYEIIHQKKIVFKGIQSVEIPASSANYAGDIIFDTTDLVGDVTINCALVDDKNEVIHHNTLAVKVFAEAAKKSTRSLVLLGDDSLDSFAALNQVNGATEKTFLVHDFDRYREKSENILQQVADGATLIFYDLAPGNYVIGNEEVTIKTCGMLPVNFVSRRTGHSLVKGFSSKAFRYWYDEQKERITPILETTFTSKQKNYEPILMSANMNTKGEWRPELACGERKLGKGSIIICNLKLIGRLETNPIAKEFTKRLLNY